MIEKSAGAIIFKKAGGQILFLLLHYPSSSKSKKPYWDLPKGHIEKGENILATVKREVLEETGLKNVEIVKGFKQTIKYFFRAEGQTVFKIVVFFLAESKEDKVVISSEHIGFQWLPFKEAVDKLTFKNAKDIVKKANGFLSN